MDGSQAAQGFTRGGAPGGFPGGMPGGRGGGMFLFGPFGGVVGIVLLVVTYVVLAFAFWQFLSKAGLTPVTALLMLVPVVNLGVALWAAFTEWPALREVARLKELVATYELRASTPAQATAESPTPAAPQ
jgi:hypothetical protein